jgi:hypothetical protein
MFRTRRTAAGLAVVVTATAALLAGSGILATSASASPPSFIGGLTSINVVASTVPVSGAGAGDQNPYGVAVVPRSTGDLTRGNVLVSNFNDAGNFQGTGTTIMQVTPGGSASVFAQISDPACPGGVGLTTALVVLRSGWVIVGSLPTQNMGATLSGFGCLIVLDSSGTVRETITGHGIKGPWDMTALDLGAITELFVTNVLGGILPSATTDHGGTVERLLITSLPFAVPRVLASTQIGSGFSARTDSAALVIGPTGVGLGRNGTLYVADTLNSRIQAIPNAVFRFSDDGQGTTVSSGVNLMGPLGLAIAPNGDILTVDSLDGNMVETTPGGNQVAVDTVDSNGGGAGNLFGLAVKPGADAVYFVDDASVNNNLQLLS